MLILHVSQVTNPGALNIKGQFDERGGTIGRAAECTLVLPDPEKHISRVQAEIRYANGQYSILNRSAVNPVVLNGRHLRQSEARILADSDEIVIAQLVLRVELWAAALQVTDDPFSDLIPKTLVTPPLLSEKKLFDNAAALGKSSHTPYIPEDAFADLAQFAPTPESPPPAPSKSARSSIARVNAQGLTDDGQLLDPFAAQGQDAQSAGLFSTGMTNLPDPLELGAAQASGENIDELFGLGKVSADPLGSGSPLAKSELRDRPSKEFPGAMPDQTPEIHSAVKLPKLQVPSPTPGEMFRSWESPSAPAALDASALASLAEQSANAHKRDFEPPPKTHTTAMLDDLNRQALSAARQPSETAQHADATHRKLDDAGEFALLKAFLLGAGLSELPRLPGSREPRGLDPATMQRIGELLRLLGDGTVNLLSNRAVSKRELRAEVTVIVAKNNNPLKFSPDAGAALAHLLSARPLRGFMDGPTAVRDAFDDLKAHQIGFLAGMKAAMQGLIARFDPAELESRLKQRSMLDAMLPMNRKAKLWELFTELFGDLAQEAEDDFEALFGRAFLRAYEEQIEQLDRKELP